MAELKAQMKPFPEPRPIVTWQQHLLSRPGRHRGTRALASEFSWLLSGITLATKIIQSQVSRAELLGVTGSTGERNVQGEIVQRLDVIANDTLKRCLGYRDSVSILVSEEEHEPQLIQDAGGQCQYVVLFDPLDGSSNIDVNVAIGTIFSILRHRPGVDSDDVMAHILQPGSRQVAAGYVMYGSSTVVVYSGGDGVHRYALDPSIGAYVLTHEDLRMPEQGKTYSVNEAYYPQFPEGLQRYLDWVKSTPAGGYTHRYVGSLVADFHRTLLRGGVFLYPPTRDAPEGKLRLLYEANPISFLAEQAGGVAIDGRGRILDRQPQSMHERTPLIVGSRREVEHVRAFLDGEAR